MRVSYWVTGLLGALVTFVVLGYLGSSAGERYGLSFACCGLLVLSLRQAFEPDLEDDDPRR